jgi:hypothetical protein
VIGAPGASMTDSSKDDSLVITGLVWAGILIGVPALVAGQSVSSGPAAEPYLHKAGPTHTPASIPPAVEPLEMTLVDPVEARAINAAVPFSRLPNPPARPFVFGGDLLSRTRAVDCLAAAMLYEAGDDIEGERAVGQVVLNRLRHPAFPKTVCAVVFHGQERRTGCQFTFTCDGAMTRRPDQGAWERARQLASAMLAGEVFRPVGYATHYHTDWVVPYWSASLEKITAVGTHLFFRWQGWWGTPSAFSTSLGNILEPGIAKLASLSAVHVADGSALAMAQGETPGLIIDAVADEKPAIAIGNEQIGKRFGAARVTAFEPEGNGVLLVIDRNAGTDDLTAVARELCTGRPLCRLMGWTSGAPKAFPLLDADLQRMSWSYIRRAVPMFERMLFNCNEYRNMPATHCMVDRTGGLPHGLTGEPGGTPRARIEVVRLRPLAAPQSEGGPSAPGSAPGTPAP